MKVHDVSALVNKPENERADCITPVADRQFVELNPLNLVSRFHCHRFIANDQPFSAVDILRVPGLE